MGRVSGVASVRSLYVPASPAAVTVLVQSQGVPVCSACVWAGVSVSSGPAGLAVQATMPAATSSRAVTVTQTRGFRQRRALRMRALTPDSPKARGPGLGKRPPTAKDNKVSL